jgi:hypothetical protein
MNRYLYAPEANTLDGIMRPINPLMGYQDRREGWEPAQGAWYLSSAAQDATGGSEGWQPMYQSWALSANPLIRSDVATPTYDMTPYPTQMPRLDGLGAVADALSVLSVVDLLTRG